MAKLHRIHLGMGVFLLLLAVGFIILASRGQNLQFSWQLFLAVGIIGAGLWLVCGKRNVAHILLGMLILISCVCVSGALMLWEQQHLFIMNDILTFFGLASFLIAGVLWIKLLLYNRGILR